jgi:hypothetical protein
LYFGRKAKEIDSFEAENMSSTDDIIIDLSPINLPLIFLATSLRVIKVLPFYSDA